MAIHLPLVDGNDLPLIGLAAFRQDSEKETKEVIRKFLTLCGDQPIKHIELSELYGNAQLVVEALLGSGLTRSELYLTYKVWPKDRDGAEIITSCVDSLKLTSQYFDLILIHAPIDLKHKYEQWSALEMLKEEGYTKSIGVCGYSERQIVELMKYCQLQPAVLEVKTFPVRSNCFSFFTPLPFSVKRRRSVKTQLSLSTAQTARYAYYAITCRRRKSNITTAPIMRRLAHLAYHLSTFTLSGRLQRGLLVEICHLFIVAYINIKSS